MGCHFLLQGIFLTQGSNPRLLHWQAYSFTTEPPGKSQMFRGQRGLLLFTHSVVLDFATPWTAAHQASLSFTISQSLLKLVSIESVMPSNHLILSHPLLLLPSIFSSIRVFSSELALQIRRPKYWSFSISPSSEYSGVISFRTDLRSISLQLDLFAVQGTLKCLLQHLNSKASVLQCSIFFMV